MFAKSPDRFSFMIEKTKEQLIKDPNNENLDRLIKFYEECKERDASLDPKVGDMEYDLRTCENIINKCKNSEKYSQNLYAALCNNIFKKEGKEWSCSWRHAGGIVANLREQGDYIDWYCSGIGNEEKNCKIDFVEEGFVIDEINSDLTNLGWTLISE